MVRLTHSYLPRSSSRECVRLKCNRGGELFVIGRRAWPSELQTTHGLINLFNSKSLERA